jgi:N4-gp56 family major capsid protein
MVSPINVTTDATVASVEIKTFYKKGLIKFAEKRTVFNQFGMAPVTIPKNQGGVFEWRRASQLTKITGAAALLTEGVTPTGSALTFEKITATPLQYGDYYAGSDLINEMTFDPILTIVVDAQAYQMAQVLDNLIQIAVLAGSTNHLYAGTGNSATNQVASGDIITEEEIRKAVRTLENNSAMKIGGNYIAVIHPNTKFTLFADPDIREALINSRNSRGSGSAGSLFTAEIGEYMGVRFVESELAPFSATGGENSQPVHKTIFFAADYFGKVELSGLNTDSIYHGIGSAGAADPLNQRWTQGWKTTHASKILNELNAVVLEHSVL